MPIYIWYPAFAGLAVGFSFMNISPLTGQFMGLFGVGYAGLSILLSALLWSHGLVLVPAGILVDRIGTHRGIVGAAAIGFTFNLLPFIDPTNLPLSTAARLGVGICTGSMFICILKLIGELTPPDQMAKVQGLYGGSFGFGTMAPYFLLPYLGDRAWAYSYIIAAAMFGITAALLALVPQGKREPVEKLKISPHTGMGQTLRVVFFSPEIWVLGLLHGMCFGSLNNLGQWLPSILGDLAGGPATAWALVTMVVLFCGSLSRSFSGHILGFFSGTFVVNGVLLLLAIIYVVFGFVRDPLCAAVLGVVLSVVAGLSHGTLFTLSSRVLAPMFMATALGLFNSIATLCNVGLTLLFGTVRGSTGSFSAALMIAGGIAFVFCIVFRPALRRIVERVC